MKPLHQFIFTHTCSKELLLSYTHTLMLTQWSWMSMTSLQQSAVQPISISMHLQSTVLAWCDQSDPIVVKNDALSPMMTVSHSNAFHFWQLVKAVRFSPQRIFHIEFWRFLCCYFEQSFEESNRPSYDDTMIDFIIGTCFVVSTMQISQIFIPQSPDIWHEWINTNGIS